MSFSHSGSASSAPSDDSTALQWITRDVEEDDADEHLVNPASAFELDDQACQRPEVGLLLLWRLAHGFGKDDTGDRVARCCVRRDVHLDRSLWCRERRSRDATGNLNVALGLRVDPIGGRNGQRERDARRRC